MKKPVVWLLLFFSFLPGRTAALDQNSSIGVHKHRGRAFAPRELLIKYKPSIRKDKAARYQFQWHIATIRKFKRTGVERVKLPQGMSVEDALEIYKKDSDVEYAEPNYYIYASATVPNDSDFNLLWGLNNTGQSVNGTSGTLDADIDAPEAWDITTGSSAVVAAVVDSGVDYNHPDLSANIWTNPAEIAGNGIDDDGNGYIDDVIGWDFVDNDNNPMDPNGHGTHVAGTIAASGNNSMGVAGVSWTSKIMVVRFLNSFGVGLTSDAISAIEYAGANHANVINCSWGGSGYSQALKDAIEASNALFVCAAGNEAGGFFSGNNDTTPEYPASYDSPNIIAVTATDQNDALAYFANFGVVSVDVAAPGFDIYSCSPVRRTIWNDDFDDNDISDWTTGGTNNSWGLTTAQSFSASYSLTDSPGANYQDNTDAWAQAPAVDLSTADDPMLEFKLRGNSEQNYDFLLVEISTDGSNWSNVPVSYNGSIFSTGISGNYFGWATARADLKAYQGQSTVNIRFRFVSDSNKVQDGWYIDDVAVTAASASYNGTEYRFLSGTSMATAHVSGLALLVKSQYPILTATQIKSVVENSVDTLIALNQIATKGRINAFKALLLPPPPSDLSAIAESTDQIRLAWTDNALDETGYMIERKTGTDGNYIQVDTLGANGIEYTDSGLNAQTTYYYRVRALNAVGNSAYSNEAAVTTASSGSDGGGGGGGGGCFINTAAQ